MTSSKLQSGFWTILSYPAFSEQGFRSDTGEDSGSLVCGQVLVNEQKQNSQDLGHSLEFIFRNNLILCNVICKSCLY